MLRYLINFILIVIPPSRFFGFRRKLLKYSSVDVGDDTRFCGGGWIYGRGRLKIGAGTWLSPSSTFYTHNDASISIGNNCDIGPGVKFITGSHHIGGKTRRAGMGTAKPIVIEDGCWIGAYSIILGGVTIGRGSVIAAGSVVTRDVGEDVLAAGVPALVRKELSE